MGEKPDNEKKTTKRISAEQKAALEAAGYKVNRSGTSVQDKDGGTVGGFNENGQISSGSSKVTAILKSSPKPVAKAPAPTTTAKPATKRVAPVVKKDGTADLVKRASAAIDRATPTRKQPARPITPTPKTTVKPKSIAGTIGAAIGGFEGRQRKPVAVPESKGTTNPISKASSSIGGALGSMAAKISTAFSKPTPPKLRPLTTADRDRTAAVSAKRLEEMRKRREKK